MSRFGRSGSGSSGSRPSGSYRRPSGPENGKGDKGKHPGRENKSSNPGGSSLGRSTPGGIRKGRPSMRGSANLNPRSVAIEVQPTAPVRQEPAAEAGPKLTRVLFVCIGNSCRSQMAEAFARAFGEGIVEVASAGTAPADIVQPLTIQVLAERNVSAEGQFAKPIEIFYRETADIVVNISGRPLSLQGPLAAAKLVNWRVQDPIGMTPDVYRGVCSQIEDLVMRLLLELRTAARRTSNRERQQAAL